MKSRKLFYSLVVMSFILNSCTTTTVLHSNSNGKVPPGQAKKASGSKSAKKYAPGQQK